MIDILSGAEVKNILTLMAKEIKALHQKRIYNQVNRDGTAYEPIKEKTRELKKAKGSKFYTQRMIDSESFVKNAFEYDINNNELEFYISNKPHAKNRNTTYSQIAREQLTGEYDQWERADGNPGADFFGMYEYDKNQILELGFKRASRMIESNIKRELKNQFNKK